MNAFEKGGRGTQKCWVVCTHACVSPSSVCSWDEDTWMWRRKRGKAVRIMGEMKDCRVWGLMKTGRTSEEVANWKSR